VSGVLIEAASNLGECRLRRGGDLVERHCRFFPSSGVEQRGPLAGTASDLAGDRVRSPF
jgi:hypothetical protein